jgi:hypothetical protein
MARCLAPVHDGAIATRSDPSMPAPLSTLGIIHTAISIAPLLLGGYALVTRGRIAPDDRLGRAYIATMLASIVTSFGLSSTGSLGPGHVLGVIAILLMGFATWPPAWLGRAVPYLRTLAMSASYLILLIPGTVETLTRVPVGSPIASRGPESPQVQAVLGVWLLLFLVGSAWQALRIRRARN